MLLASAVLLRAPSAFGRRPRLGFRQIRLRFLVLMSALIPLVLVILVSLPCSCAAPEPTKSPTTTRPVAIPTRVCNVTDDLSDATPSINSSPARAARSASSS